MDVELVLRKIAYRASRVMVPAIRRKVAHIALPSFDLLVLMNEDVGRQIAYLHRYEARDSALLATLVKPGDICFDVGGNTGFYTMLMASCATAGQVHAFEPMPLNWHLLSSGVILNGFRHVTANNCALGAQSGLTSFSQSTDGAYSSLIAVGRKPEAEATKVMVRTIDDYLADTGLTRLDVLKADVEGAEALVIQGAAEVFSDPKRRPRIVLLELFDENLRVYGTSVTAVVEQMGLFGYAPYIVDVHAGLKPFGSEHHNHYYNVFFAAEPSHLQATGRDA